MSMNKKTRSLYGSREEAQRIYYQRQRIKTQQNIIDKLQQENSQLKEKIEKAIEYIEKNKLNTNKISEMLCGSEVMTLLEVLKGDKGGMYEKIPVCTLCGEEIGDFDDGGIYEGEYCETCFQDAQESRLK